MAFRPTAAENVWRSLQGAAIIRNAPVAPRLSPPAFAASFRLPAFQPYTPLLSSRAPEQRYVIRGRVQRCRPPVLQRRSPRGKACTAWITQSCSERWRQEALAGRWGGRSPGRTVRAGHPARARRARASATRWTWKRTVPAGETPALPSLTMDDLAKTNSPRPRFSGRRGCLFYDITTLLQDPAASVRRSTASRFRSWARASTSSSGSESRGFILAAGGPDRRRLCTGARKPGKLPSTKVSATYNLGMAPTRSRFSRRCREERASSVLIVDDLLATGGTARATSDLVKGLGGGSTRWRFIGLVALNGRARLARRDDPQRAEVLTDDVLVLAALIVAAALWWPRSGSFGELRAASETRRRAVGIAQASSGSSPRESPRRGTIHVRSWSEAIRSRRSRASCACRPTARRSTSRGRRIVSVPAGSRCAGRPRAVDRRLARLGRGPTTAMYMLKAATAEQALRRRTLPCCAEDSTPSSAKSWLLPTPIRR